MRLWRGIGILCVGLCIMASMSCYAAQHAKAKPTAREVLQILREGNARFVAGKSTHPRLDRQRLQQAGTESQADHAIATVLTCSDSRVPVELLFDQGIMDLFVVRVAGNVVRTDEAGSIEYGLAHVHTPLLVVLGHTQCGAVTAVTQAMLGRSQPLERNIPPLVAPIGVAVRKAMDAHPELHGEAVIPAAIEQNIWQGVEDLFMMSPATRELVRQGLVLVTGAMYDVKTGRVTWLPLEKVDAILERVQAHPEKTVEPMAE